VNDTRSHGYISAPMLALAATHLVPTGWAAIEFLEAPATAIGVPDDTFDAVLCAHGLQFFPGRAEAIGEMRRVARPGGVVVVSTWAAERPLGLFGPIAETLQELGLAEPYPRAFDPGSYCLDVASLADLLRASGWRDVEVETVELDARWDRAEAVASTLLGTPFGPLITALAGDAQDQVRARLITKLGGPADGITVRTASNIARGIKLGARRRRRPAGADAQVRPSGAGFRTARRGRRRGCRGLRRRGRWRLRRGRGRHAWLSSRHRR
jgi:SAM-dependent methyltransferase